MTLVSSWTLQEKKKSFNHINSLDPHIQFTSENAKPDGSIPFLDTIVMPQPHGSLKTTVYRKPTHTDMYLHWDSYHHLSAKFSVINTLRHRAKTVCSNSQLLKEEEDHLNHALRRCKYPLWALDRVNINQNQKRKNKGTKDNNSTNTSKSYIVVTLHESPGRKLQKHLQETWELCISGEAVPSKISWYTQKIKIPYYRKVGWSTGRDVEGWIVKMSTLESQAGLLEKGSGNICEHHPPS